MATRKNQEMKSKAAAYRTQEKLSFANCQNSFQNMLRTGDSSSGHVETKICNVPIKVNRRRDQVSHIFTGEDPATIRPSGRALGKYTPSSVMFNDYYIETNPRIVPERKLRYEIEKKAKDNAKYSDDFVISKKRKDLMQRKIDDNFLHNPLKVYNKAEMDKYNKEQYEQTQKHAKAFYKTFGSDNCKKTLGGSNNNKIKFEAHENDNKITNNNFDITKRAMDLNKNEYNKVPYYARKHFRHASCGRGQAMCYS